MRNFLYGPINERSRDEKYKTSTLTISESFAFSKRDDRSVERLKAESLFVHVRGGNSV